MLYLILQDKGRIIFFFFFCDKLNFKITYFKAAYVYYVNLPVNSKENLILKGQSCRNVISI